MVEFRSVIRMWRGGKMELLKDCWNVALRGERSQGDRQEEVDMSCHNVRDENVSEASLDGLKL